MSTAPIVIIITRPTQPSGSARAGKGTTSEIQVLAPASATDADVLRAALAQLEGGSGVA